jgi:hypothetical protein
MFFHSGPIILYTEIYSTVPNGVASSLEYAPQFCHSMSCHLRYFYMKPGPWMCRFMVLFVWWWEKVTESISLYVYLTVEFLNAKMPNPLTRYQIRLHELILMTWPTRVSRKSLTFSRQNCYYVLGAGRLPGRWRTDMTWRTQAGCQAEGDDAGRLPGRWWWRGRKPNC